MATGLRARQGVRQGARQLARVLLAAGDLTVLWLPCVLGAGVALWFALASDPSPGLLAVLGGAAAGGLALFLAGPDPLRPVGAAVLALALGVLAADLRSRLVEAPMLTGRYWGPVQGRVIAIDRSQSDKPRITLDRVVLRDLAPADTPLKVRLSLHGPPGPLTPLPGQIVMVTAHLAAPDGPVEPGGFDFRRMAFFERLGAVGYTRSPMVLWEDAAPGDQRVNRLRLDLSRAIRQAVPGQPGAFAAGAMTGDRSGIDQPTVEALRDSSLAHLLAISGMNMAFLTGFVFALVRHGLALVPPLALRLNTKKLAAVGALGVAWFYLLLSGANVATERAFIMVVVMLGAVLLDRRALSLRSVALAGLILLLAKPESLLSPGFQMSFAATIALIWGFERVDHGALKGRLPRWSRPVYLLVLSSVLAGLATAPFAAAHFNRLTDYGLLANLLTVPVMSILMAAGAMAALLAPLGLEGPALWVMGLAAQWILSVAHGIAALEGAVTAVPTPGPAVLPLISLAGLWLVLAQGRWRAGALPVLALALGLWAGHPRPDLLVSGDGALAGLAGPGGRALSAPRGAGFAAENWLQNDGDLAPQEQASARPGFSGPRGERMFLLAGEAAVTLTGKAAAERLADACRRARLVIVAASVADHPPGCTVIDRGILARTGPVAITLAPDGLHLLPTRAAHRRWTAGLPAVAPMDFRPGEPLRLVPLPPGPEGRPHRGAAP